MAGVQSEEFHWTLAPGESFLTPEAVLTSCRNGSMRVKKEAANRISEDSRMAELTAYLAEHLGGFQQYDDGIVRQLVERITVVDAETIRIKFRYSDVEIEQTMC